MSRVLGTRGDLSRRLGPVFAEQALSGFLPAAQPRAVANPQIAAIKVPAKAYKPTHGGYPG